MPDLTLQGAYANQFTRDGVRGDYNLISSKQEPLGQWPKKLNDAEVFQLLEFARGFELEAYDLGVKEERDRATAYINEMKRRHENLLAEIRRENERLAEKLGQLIGEQE